ncbi:MAG: phosphoribosylamine--glycine ligase [Acidobacteriota bacterium]
MKVLVVGSGGREHTIAWKIRQDSKDAELICAPGNAGTARLGTNAPVSADDIDGLLDLARSEKVDLTMVGPEAPLVEGIADRFRKAGLAVAGPSAKAAQLEGSKAFAKDFMRRYGIPTARYRVFGQASEAESSLRSGEFPFPAVLKADGLAAGKGVIICQDLPQALQTVDAVMRQGRFGAAGARLLVEEFLTGEEASFMVFSDGSRILPMVPSQDHKAAYDGDQGPNTGGMGAYSCPTVLSEGQQQEILAQVMEPAVRGMASEGCPFQGILYAGLMLGADGAKVLEFNARFGDPETQVVLPRLKSSLLEILQALAAGDLSGVEPQWDSRAAVCVVLAAPGYPGSYPKGLKISGLDMAQEASGTVVFHAGTSLDERGSALSSGGRVLGVTALCGDLEAAILQAYEGVNKIHFEGMHYRRDIASKGLKRAQA